MAVASHKADPLGVLKVRESVTASKHFQGLQRRGVFFPATNLLVFLKSSAGCVWSRDVSNKKMMETVQGDQLTCVADKTTGPSHQNQ